MIASEARAKTAEFGRQILTKIESEIEKAIKEGQYECKVEFHDDNYDDEELEKYDSIVSNYFKEKGFKVIQSFPITHISWRL